MDIGELRTSFKAYLEKRLRIDYWGLGLPDSASSSDKPPSIGLDKPALDIEFLSSEGFGKSKTITTETTIPFQIIYRFDSSYSYNQLPRAEAETLLSQILFELQDSICINPDIESLQPSGSVSIAEHKNGDQLIIFEIDIKPQFKSENNPVVSQFFSP